MSETFPCFFFCSIFQLHFSFANLSYFCIFFPQWNTKHLLTGIFFPSRILAGENKPHFTIIIIIMILCLHSYDIFELNDKFCEFFFKEIKQNPTIHRFQPDTKKKFLKFLNTNKKNNKKKSKSFSSKFHQTSFVFYFNQNLF